MSMNRWSSGPSPTLDAASREELLVLSRNLHKRLENISKNWDAAYLLARPFEEMAPPHTQLHEKREELMRVLELRTPPWYILDPGGRIKRVWNAAACTLILADAFYIPFLIAYFSSSSCSYLWAGKPFASSYLTTALSLGWQVFPIFVTAFFLVDMALTCMTGYVTRKDNQRVLESRLLPIWWRYARTWLVVDLLPCLPVQCLLSTYAAGAFNLGYLMGLIRLLTVWRRAHGPPFRWIEGAALKRGIVSRSVVLLCNVVYLCALLLHVFVCSAWLAVRFDEGNKSIWVVQIGIQKAFILHQYLWQSFNAISAMIMLTYGSYTPILWQEALVWCFMATSVAGAFMLINLIIVAIIVEGSTGRLLFKSRMDVVLTALRGQDLPVDLRKSILDHFQYALSQDRARTISNTPKLFQELPDDLAMEAAACVCGRFLAYLSPVFRGDDNLCAITARLLVSRSAYYKAGEYIMRQGWPADEAFFLYTGMVDMYVDGIRVETFSPGQLVGAEALLPLPSDASLQEKGIMLEDVTSFQDTFTHLATARALTNCRGYLLAAADFQQAAMDSPAAMRWLESEAQKYIANMRKGHVHLHREGRTPLTDVLDAGGMSVPLATSPQARVSIFDLHSSVRGAHP
eukprot:jgi/Botrbrau1/1293/Bobra.0063s0010.1